MIVQNRKPDEFFDQAKQQRLAHLMDRWRLARDSGTPLPSNEQAELDTLVEAEIEASAERTASMLGSLG